MDLYYEVNGNGHPVVLLHSGGADLRDWTFLTSLLAKHYKVVTFDGRGTGKSPFLPALANTARSRSGADQIQ